MNRSISFAIRDLFPALLASGILSAALAVLLAGAAIAGEASPTTVYLEYHKALQTAQAIDAVASFMSKKVNDEIQTTPADMKPMMFGMIKDLTPKVVQVTSEKIDGDHATLTLATSDSSQEAAPTKAALPNAQEKTEGSVTLVRESGSWKIDKESWKSSTVTTGPSPDAHQ